MAKPNVESHYGAYIVRGELVQTDWDFPATAESCGWNMRRVQRTPETYAKLSPLCHCGETRFLQRAPNRDHGCSHVGTDGTIDCRDCGVTASEFISAAAEYLDSLC